VTIRPLFGVLLPSETRNSSYVLKGASLRRLYSTFAGGWPGTGLLLLRLVIGSALVVRATSKLWIDPPLNVTIPAVLAIGAGILLIAGLWTPIVGISVALIEIWKIIMLPGDKWVWLLLGTAGAALAMLGPGLWSVDARLFGWKRIEALPRENSSHSR
jgi:uncharacterized membrane protein YphA (DoxX/SURF4 family)